MGMTRFMYSAADMLWLLTSLRMRTHMKPIVEQKDMCHTVSAMGKGKPEKASSLREGQGGGSGTRSQC